MASPEFHALELPPDAIEKGGHEVLRASVVDGAVSVAMRRSFDDPHVWGLLLADLARQAARLYAIETGLSDQDALEQIYAGIETGMARPADSGDTKPAH
jgi:hypothetical protein